jgi:hypothetical protein
VASFFFASKRPVVACSGGLPSKARGGAAPEDSDCASRPGGGAAWRRWALGNESGNGEKCHGGYLDGPYIRGQDQGGAKGGGGYDRDLQQNREVTMIHFGFEERIHVRYDLGKIFLGSLLPCEGRKPALGMESWRSTRPSWSRGAKHGAQSKGKGARQTAVGGVAAQWWRAVQWPLVEWAITRRENGLGKLASGPRGEVKLIKEKEMERVGWRLLA